MTKHSTIKANGRTEPTKIIKTRLKNVKSCGLKDPTRCCEVAHRPGGVEKKC